MELPEVDDGPIDPSLGFDPQPEYEFDGCWYIRRRDGQYCMTRDSEGDTSLGAAYRFLYANPVLEVGVEPDGLLGEVHVQEAVGPEGGLVVDAEQRLG